MACGLRSLFLGIVFLFVWNTQVEARRCVRRYRCYTKKYCDLKPVSRRKRRQGTRNVRFRYRCTYRRYCRKYWSCSKKKKRPVPPPPPPPPPGYRHVMDFEKPTQNTIPKARLLVIVKQSLPSIFGCFTAQLRRDSRFRGVRVSFTIRGDRGRVGHVSFEDAERDYLRLLGCIRKFSKRWQFPRFNGSTFVVYPIYVRRQ